MKEEFRTVLEERSNMYGFLSRIYRVEADADLIQHLLLLDWSKMGGEYSPEMRYACEKINKVLKKPLRTLLLETARDYARCFYGAGLSRGGGAYPYESVYTSENRHKEQKAMFIVNAIYAENGLQKSEKYTEPDDHLSIEFEYMKYLCDRAAETLDDINVFASFLDKQQFFLEGHLLNWVPAFCNDLERIAEYDFFKAAAVITNALVQDDKQTLLSLKSSMNGA